MQHRMAEQQRQPVHFIRTRDQHDVECYFVLRSPRGTVPRLLAQKAKAPVNLAGLGEILESGYGHPTPAICRKLRQEYGLIISEY